VIGSSATRVTVCLSGQPDFVESVDLNVELEWWLTVQAKYGLVEATVGPFTGSAGITGGFFGSQVRFHDGSSPLVRFNVDAEVLTGGAMGGPYIDFGFKLGHFQAKTSIEYVSMFTGDGARPTDQMLVSLGLGFLF